MQRIAVVVLTLVMALSFTNVAIAAKIKKVIEVEEEGVYTGMKMAGKLGFGYTSSNTPLGVKYWPADAMALDVGFGVTTGAVVQNFGMTVGINFVMVSNEPILLQSRGSMGFATGAVTNLSWMGALGGEYFVTKNLSLNIDIGLLFQWQVSPASAFTFSHNAGTTGNLGIYYYF